MDFLLVPVTLTDAWERTPASRALQDVAASFLLEGVFFVRIEEAVRLGVLVHELHERLDRLGHWDALHVHVTLVEVDRVRDEFLRVDVDGRRSLRGHLDSDRIDADAEVETAVRLWPPTGNQQIGLQAGRTGRYDVAPGFG